MSTLSTSRLTAYSAIGVPIAFVGLPIYVHVPHFYATTLGVELVAISIALLLVRCLDAFQDPLIGVFSDRSSWSRRKIIAWASPALILSFIGLFAVPDDIPQHWLVYWMVAMLVVVYTSFSTIMINFYAAGLPLSHDSKEQTRISAFREGAVLIGVMIAAALPSLLTESYDDRQAYTLFALIFLPIALIGIALTFASLRGLQKQKYSDAPPSLKEQFSLLKRPHIRYILALFSVNSLPTAITSTLFLFYVEDRLGAKEQAGYMLLCFFFAAALSVAGWNVLANRIGKQAALLIGMVLAVLTFAWAATLGLGDTLAFYGICAASGIAIGADLTIMPSLYADALGEDTEAGGVGFSLWHFLNKLNLSLAAGIVLPLLAWLGYTPSNTIDYADTTPLLIAYAVIPCILKLGAIAMLWRLDMGKLPS